MQQQGSLVANPGCRIGWNTLARKGGAVQSRISDSASSAPEGVLNFSLTGRLEGSSASGLPFAILSLLPTLHGPR